MFENLLAIELCSWGLAQVTVFVLKPVNITECFLGTFIIYLVANRGRGSIVDYFNIRLRCKGSITGVPLPLICAWIRFIIGILALAHILVMEHFCFHIFEKILT